MINEEKEGREGVTMKEIKWSENKRRNDGNRRQRRGKRKSQKK